MKSLLIKKAIISVVYMIAAAAIELISFIAMGFGFVIPNYFFVDLIVLFGLGFLVFAMPSTILQILSAILLLSIEAAVTWVNQALNQSSQMVFGLNMLNLVNEVTGAFNDNDFVDWGLLFGLICIILGTSLAFVFASSKIRSLGAGLKNNAIIILLCVFLAQNSFFSVSVIMGKAIKNNIPKSDYTLWTEQNNTKSAYRKFGFFGFYYKNVDIYLNNIFNNDMNESEYEESMSELDNYFGAGQMSETDYDGLYTGKLDGKNIVLIVIESGEWYAINKEYTPTLYAMATQGISMTQYYARDKTNHSEALSILGSYPVNSTISSSVEGDGLKGASLSFTLPNILGTDGYSTHYFHANYGDFYDRNGVFEELYGFDDAHFIEDMTLLKGSEGRKTSFTDFDKDSEVIKSYSEEYTAVEEGNNTFFTMQMTLISHGSYNDLIENGDYTADLSDEEKEKLSKLYTVKGLEEYYEIIDSYPETFVEGTPYIDYDGISELTESEQRNLYLRYKRYQAGIMDLDNGVNSLIGKLRQSNQLADTAFIFYADHSCYYNEMNYYMKGVKAGNNFDMTLYNIPFFIWCGESMYLDVSALDVDGYGSIHYEPLSYSGLMRARVDKFCNSLDLLPTVLQLCGYSYNKNLYQGRSVFTSDSSTFVSRESGCMYMNSYYDGLYIYRKQEDGTFNVIDYEEYSALEGEVKDEEAEALINGVVYYYIKQRKLERLYQCDYFSRRDIFKGYSSSDIKPITYLEKI